MKSIYDNPHNLNERGERRTDEGESPITHAPRDYVRQVSPALAEWIKGENDIEDWRQP